MVNRSVNQTFGPWCDTPAQDVNGGLRVFKWIITTALGGLFAAGMPVVAAPRVAIVSDVFVEQAGESRRVLQPASLLRPGDRVVTIVTWKRSGAGRDFTVTNPLPRALQFQGSADGAEQVSVDGGRTWGRLGQLRAGGYVAVPEDVTHVRWRIATPAPQGRIAYSAIVR